MSGEDWFGFRDNRGRPSLGISWDGWGGDVELGGAGGVAARAPSSEERRAINRDRDHSQWGAKPPRQGKPPGKPNPGSPSSPAGGRPSGRGGLSFDEFMAYQRQQRRGQVREQRESVYDWVRSSFDQWGMPGGFADSVIGIVRDARSPEHAMTLIRDTDAYKTRFAGNIARSKAGLPMLSESEYLGLERSYSEAAHYAGLPKGFLDNDDYSRFIAGDVSVAEIAERASLAGDLAVRKDPVLWKELKTRGVTRGDAAAFLLNPDKALPAIKRKLAGAEIGLVGRDAGMNFADDKKNKFENKLVDRGVSADEARGAFGEVADDKRGLNQLAGRFGEDGFTDKQLAKAELGIGGKKTRKVKERRQGLLSQERAQWAGSGNGAGTFGNAGV